MTEDRAEPRKDPRADGNGVWRTGFWSMAVSPIVLASLTVLVILFELIFRDGAGTVATLHLNLMLCLLLVGYVATLAYRLQVGAWPSSPRSWRQIVTHNRWPEGHPYHRPGRDE